MKMDIKYKMEINKVVLELYYEEALDLRTLLHDYVDNVEDNTIKTCCNNMLDTAKSLLKQLDNMELND